jgi:hypothetical protein
MTEKIYDDYGRLKEFTETLRMKFKLVINCKNQNGIAYSIRNLDAEQVNSIQKINEAVSKLSS